jgi:DDE superfamily endonuclease
MDNLATHKIAGIREAIAAAGARRLYLPPDAPDFNPSENRCSKIKQILRSPAPRTESALLLATKTAFQTISPADCQGYFLAPNTLYDLWNCSKYPANQTDDNPYLIFGARHGRQSFDPVAA